MYRGNGALSDGMEHLSEETSDKAELGLPKFGFELMQRTVNHGTELKVWSSSVPVLALC